jgi:N-acyl-D-aspartate/D-glutamate deacylase
MKMMKKRLTVILMVSVAIVLVASTSLSLVESDKEYDLLVKNGLIHEGSLKEPYKADIAIKNGTIVKIGPSIKGSAAAIIEAEGLHVTPGFIDLHTHVEVGMDTKENRACLNYLTQGVTTSIVGHCGYSPWIIYEKPEVHMKRLSEEGVGLNLAFLFGQGGIRRLVVGDENREATPEEIEQMKHRLKEAMEQGAFGISTSRDYPPGSFARTDEVAELVKVVKTFGGLYHTHMLKEGSDLLGAIKEALEIAEKTGVPTHLSHLKVVGEKHWGMAKKACDLIEKARSKGLRVTADQYPYRFGGEGPSAKLIPYSVWVGDAAKNRQILTPQDIRMIYDHLPDSVLTDIYSKVTPYAPLSQEHRRFVESLSRKRLVNLVAQSVYFPLYLRMGVLNILQYQPVDVSNTKLREMFLARLEKPEEKKKIYEGMAKNIERAGASNIIVEVCVDKEFEGKSLQQIASAKGQSVEETAIKLGLMGAKVVPLLMCEEDIEYIMSRDYVGTGSDGTSPYYGLNDGFGSVHIRSYTTFLHKIKKYALERKAVTLEHVIRSQTSLPAAIMGFRDRGLIKPGYKADINVIDMDNISIKATVRNPHQYCEGIRYLIMNGKLVIEEGQWNGTLAGKVLKLKQTES